MQLQQLIARQAVDRRDRSLGAAPVRMAARIEKHHQRLGRANGGIVFVLPDRGHDFALARHELIVRRRRRHQDVADPRQHRLEIVGEAGADQREEMTCDRNRQRDAAAVQLLGNLGGRARRGAAIDDARQQPCRSRRSGGIGSRTRAHREINRHGRRRRGVLGEERRAVGQRDANRIERHQATGTGSK